MSLPAGLPSSLPSLEGIELPSGRLLPAEVPKIFSALPEYCMDDIAQFFKQLQHIAPDFLESVAIEELHDFVIECNLEIPAYGWQTMAKQFKEANEGSNDDVLVLHEFDRV